MCVVRTACKLQTQNAGCVCVRMGKKIAIDSPEVLKDFCSIKVSRVSTNSFTLPTQWSMVIHTQAYCTSPSLQEKHNLLTQYPHLPTLIFRVLFCSKTPGNSSCPPWQSLIPHLPLSLEHIAVQYVPHQASESTLGKGETVHHLQGPGQSENVGPFSSRICCFPQLS